MPAGGTELGAHLAQRGPWEITPISDSSKISDAASFVVLAIFFGLIFKIYFGK